MKRHDKLIIFDLDDTLLDTSEIYWQARTHFVQLMAQEGFNPETVTELFEGVDTAHIVKFGIAPERYGETMAATCRLLFKQTNRIPSLELLQKVKSCGNLIKERLPVLIDGADDLLNWSSQHFELALLTRGIESLQKRKIEAAGIDRYFHIRRIVEKKDAQAFRQLIEEASYTPSDAWVIGDSVKSDINPGNEAGATCILYEYSHPHYFWRQEYGALASGTFYKIHSLREAILILKSPGSFPMIKGLKNLSRSVQRISEE